MGSCLKSAVIGLLVVMWSTTCLAESISREQIRMLDEQTQDVKKDVLDIYRSLVQLEEKVIYPPNTQVSIFLSVAKENKSRIEGIRISIDGKEVADHAYTSSELEALQHGGLHRVYIGNVRPGEHELEVALNEKKAGFKFTKDVTTKLIEIVLAGSMPSNQVISFRD